ncbi:uncharacterized protein HMPREF1541_06174 [Cyphellophora europaea CBS 101466]|uniref:Uncharacterized protein n=1 Tax=Cyphellophora europaea (strain CBS 101466) TaxID=1220924 RepID=W2RU47_CYPE1|nr:uncharacterized protein HMPREF1541_06174 [Cyphellophora europaea CBS 101466]ETN39947.1 hypothetical protein HMPREF1541_06174 [Cyphellophora europaea CBS 101466]
MSEATSTISESLWSASEPPSETISSTTAPDEPSRTTSTSPSIESASSSFLPIDGDELLASILPSPSTSSRIKKSSLAGVVVGAIAIVDLATLALIWRYKKRHAQRISAVSTTAGPHPDAIDESLPNETTDATAQLESPASSESRWLTWKHRLPFGRGDTKQYSSPNMVSSYLSPSGGPAWEKDGQELHELPANECRTYAEISRRRGEYSTMSGEYSDGKMGMATVGRCAM